MAGGLGPTTTHLKSIKSYSTSHCKGIFMEVLNKTRNGKRIFFGVEILMSDLGHIGFFPENCRERNCIFGPMIYSLVTASLDSWVSYFKTANSPIAFFCSAISCKGYPKISQTKKPVQFNYFPNHFSHMPTKGVPETWIKTTANKFLDESLALSSGMTKSSHFIKNLAVTKV